MSYEYQLRNICRLGLFI